MKLAERERVALAEVRKLFSGRINGSMGVAGGVSMDGDSLVR